MQRVYAIAYTDPLPPSELVPGLPDQVSALALSLIAKDASHRLQDIQEILRRFDALPRS